MYVVCTLSTYYSFIMLIRKMSNGHLMVQVTKFNKYKFWSSKVRLCIVIILSCPLISRLLNYWESQSEGTSKQLPIECWTLRLLGFASFVITNDNSVWQNQHILRIPIKKTIFCSKCCKFLANLCKSLEILEQCHVKWWLKYQIIEQSHGD